MVAEADDARQLENPMHMREIRRGCFAGDVLAAGSCVYALPLMT